MKELRFTVYEVFGYLFPGVTAVTGSGLLFWTLYFPRRVLPVRQLSLQTWVLVIVLAYIAGHVVQGIANRLLDKRSAREEGVLLEGATSTHGLLVARARERVAAGLGVKSEHIQLSWLTRIMSAEIGEYAKGNDREIYVYREGFYRGMAVAFAYLTIGLTARILAPQCGVRYGGETFEISRAMQMFPLVVVIVSCDLFYERYKRFREYRVKHALLTFLALTSNSREVDEKEPSMRGGLG